MLGPESSVPTTLSVLKKDSDIGNGQVSFNVFPLPRYPIVYPITADLVAGLGTYSELQIKTILPVIDPLSSSS